MIQQSHYGSYILRKSNHKDTCSWMLIAALFTITRTWKQPKCPLTDEWIKKMWYIYTMECYSVIKRNYIGLFLEMKMDLESVIQSKVSQRKKNHILMHVWHHSNCSKWRGTKEPLNESERRKWKSWLTTFKKLRSWHLVPSLHSK